MGRLALTKFINNPEVNKVLNPDEFELLCGNCDYFETKECPHYGEVLNLTEACNKYYD